MMTQIPDTIGLITASIHARHVSENCHAAYWLEGENIPIAKYRRQEAWEHLEKLAAVFGAKLVEIEPEADEEQPDAEIIAARKASAEQDLIGAGRGHLIGGAA